MAHSGTNGWINTSLKNIEEAQHFATQWLWTDNNERPNMGIGGITPAQNLFPKWARSDKMAA